MRPHRRWNLDQPTTRGRQVVVSLGVAGLAFLILLATAIPLPIVWDEGDALDRAARVRHWAAALRTGGELDAATIARDWPFTVVLEGHPALLGWVVVAGQRVAGEALPPLLAARCGPMLLFAIALGAVFYRLWRDVTFSVAAVAIGAMLLTPRLFAHAHFALYDSLVTSCWLLCWAMFRPALGDWRWSLAWGAALGAVLSAKFTGWLAPAPFLIWAAWYRDRRALVTLAIAAPVALAVFWALNPPLWHAPWSGLRAFLYLNLHRGENPQFNISSLYFGVMHDLDHPPPWHNPLVWTVITVLPFTFIWGMVGVYQALKRWTTDRMAVLAVLNWLSLVVVRALPWAPAHDGERLILPSFAFFAIVAALGVGRLLYRNSLLLPEKICAQRWVFVLLTIGAANGLFSLVRFGPQWLSYYSPVVGGLRGAEALGFDATYYWDSLDGPTLRWLDEHTFPDERVIFGAGPRRSLAWLRRWHDYEFLDTTPGKPRWYVIQRRESSWTDADRWLINHAEPAYEKRIVGVPLLDVYRYADFERAEQAPREDAQVTPANP